MTGPALLAEYAIQTELLSKSFGLQDALKNVSLKIKAGQNMVVLGPNGAGKTTLLKIFSTMMNPTSGKLLIFGLDAKKEAEIIRRNIGVVSHQSYFYPGLTAYENLEFYAQMNGISGMQDRIQKVVAEVGMTARLYDRTNTMSRGMQQRFSIARALLHDPEIVLLDEPETGLDVEALSMLWKIMGTRREKKRTMIFSTHNLERTLEVSDRVLILRGGKIVYEKETAALNVASLRQVYQETTVGKV